MFGLNRLLRASAFGAACLPAAAWAGAEEAIVGGAIMAMGMLVALGVLVGVDALMLALSLRSRRGPVFRALAVLLLIIQVLLCAIGSSTALVVVLVPLLPLKLFYLRPNSDGRRLVLELGLLAVLLGAGLTFGLLQRERLHEKDRRENIPFYDEDHTPARRPAGELRLDWVTNEGEWTLRVDSEALHLWARGDHGSGSRVGSFRATLRNHELRLLMEALPERADPMADGDPASTVRASLKAPARVVELSAPLYARRNAEIFINPSLRPVHVLLKEIARRAAPEQTVGLRLLRQGEQLVVRLENAGRLPVEVSFSSAELFIEELRDGEWTRGGDVALPSAALVLAAGAHRDVLTGQPASSPRPRCARLRGQLQLRMEAFPDAGPWTTDMRSEGL